MKTFELASYYSLKFYNKIYGKEKFGSSQGGAQIQLMARDYQDTYQIHGLDKYLNPWQYYDLPPNGNELFPYNQF
jgi:hypothetical protein